MRSIAMRLGMLATSPVVLCAAAGSFNCRCNIHKSTACKKAIVMKL